MSRQSTPQWATWGFLYLTVYLALGTLSIWVAWMNQLTPCLYPCFNLRGSIFPIFLIALRMSFQYPGSFLCYLPSLPHFSPPFFLDFQLPCIICPSGSLVSSSDGQIPVSFPPLNWHGDQKHYRPIMEMGKLPENCHALYKCKVLAIVLYGSLLICQSDW